MIRFGGGKSVGVGSDHPVTPTVRGAMGAPPSDNQSVMDASVRASGSSSKNPFRIVTPTPAPAARKPFR